MRVTIERVVLASLLVGALVIGRATASQYPHPVIQRPAGESIAAGTTLAASRSVTFCPTGGGSGQSYGLAMLYTTITDADDSESGVVVSCAGYREGGTIDYAIPACPWDSTNSRYDCDDSDGKGAKQYWDPSDETAEDTKSRVFRIDVEGFTKVTCTYDFTGGSASDSIEALVDVATKS